jgi:hypothetical protein
MALVISPTNTERDGGYKITLTGLSLVSGDYYFHVGPLGTHEDPRAYAGAYGSGDVVTVAASGCSFATPPGEFGIHAVSAYSTASPAVSGTVVHASGLTYHNKNHRSEAFAYRSLQVDWLDVGPRAIIEEEPQ